jgi:arylsulfatase A-like enzyme
MASRDADKPNIVFVLTDDQGFWAMGCAGNSEIRTPNLDRLAQTGIRFENFHCATPVCSAARASILTGQISTRHGVLDWLRHKTMEKEWSYEPGRIEYLKDLKGYTDYLAQAGYTCGQSGKWHMGNGCFPQKGFTFWKAYFGGGGPYYAAEMVDDNNEVYIENRYVTEVITENALPFLDQEKGTDAPFYLNVHYTAPHGPWERKHHPKDTYDDYYENCAFESCPDEAQHKWSRARLEFFESPDKRRSHLAGYFTAVTEMDKGVGMILDRLEEQDLRENTLSL